MTFPQNNLKKARSSAVEKNVTAVLTAVSAKSPVSVPTSIALPCHSTRHAWGEEVASMGGKDVGAEVGGLRFDQ